MVDKWNSLTDTRVNCKTVNNFKDYILKELEPEICNYHVWVWELALEAKVCAYYAISVTMILMASVNSVNCLYMLKSPVMRDSWGVVAAVERKELNSSKKTEKGLEDLEDKGGR